MGGRRSLPAISSGIFAVPLRICSRAYVKGIQKHFAERPDSSVQEVRITLRMSFSGESLKYLIEEEMDKMGGQTGSAIP